MFRTDPTESILIVDDEPIILKLIKKIIERNGYSPVTSTSPREAFSLALRTRPSLIISDFDFPGYRDGVDLCTQIRNDLDHNIPVIIISGHSENEHKSRQQGFDFLHKPVNQTTLMGKIEGYLSRV